MSFHSCEWVSNRVKGFWMLYSTISKQIKASGLQSLLISPSLTISISKTDIRFHYIAFFLYFHPVGSNRFRLDFNVSALTQSLYKWGRTFHTINNVKHDSWVSTRNQSIFVLVLTLNLYACMHNNHTDDSSAFLLSNRRLCSVCECTYLNVSSLTLIRPGDPVVSVRLVKLTVLPNRQ